MAITLTPPPPRATPFFQPKPQVAQLPGSLRRPEPPQREEKQVDEGLSPVAPDPHQLSQPWSGWFRNIFNVLRPGVTKDVVISGTTLHFVNGIFTGSSP
jgi:hypothetical protein